MSTALAGPAAEKCAHDAFGSHRLASWQSCAVRLAAMPTQLCWPASGRLPGQQLSFSRQARLVP